MSLFAIVMFTAAAVLVGVIIIAALRQRRPKSDDGVQSFQRHLGALSPEARRSSIDRAQNPRSKGDT
jgi:hypothetical protein